MNCPKTPKTELIRINSEAAQAICFGYPAFRRNSIGLRKIPPPIPTMPEKKPIIDPIIMEKTFENSLILKSLLFKILNIVSPNLTSLF